MALAADELERRLYKPMFPGDMEKKLPRLQHLVDMTQQGVDIVRERLRDQQTRVVIRLRPGRDPVKEPDEEPGDLSRSGEEGNVATLSSTGRNASHGEANITGAKNESASKHKAARAGPRQQQEPLGEVFQLDWILGGEGADLDEPALEEETG